MKQIMTDEEYQEKYGSAWEFQRANDERTVEWEGKTATQQEQSRELAIAEQEEDKNKKETRVEKFKKYAYLDSVQTSFMNLLGGNDKVAKRYIESIVIAVASKTELQECSAKSIMIAALRAASLGLSVDPALSQAHLVPFKIGDTKEVTLIVDYHGLVQMAVDTNYYAIAPHVSEVYEGEAVKKDRFSGQITIEGEKISETVIGWLAYSKGKNGIERWLYMTNEECDHHAEVYNPGGYTSKASPWNNKKGENKPKMRRKTCLRIFVKRWGNFSPAQQQVFMNDEPVIEGDFINLPDPSIIPDPEPAPEPTAEERKAKIEAALIDLGYKQPVKEEAK